MMCHTMWPMWTELSENIVCLSKVKIFSNLFRTNKDSLKDYLSYQRNLYLLRFQVASFRQLQERLPVSFQNPGGGRIDLFVIS